MFETSSDVVEALLANNNYFRRLYEKHASLKVEVARAQRGTGELDDQHLTTLKKRKLLLKDQMARLIAQNSAHRAAA